MRRGFLRCRADAAGRTRERTEHVGMVEEPQQLVAAVSCRATGFLKPKGKAAAEASCREEGREGTGGAGGRGGGGARASGAGAP